MIIKTVNFSIKKNIIINFVVLLYNMFQMLSKNIEINRNAEYIFI